MSSKLFVYFRAKPRRCTTILVAALALPACGIQNTEYGRSDRPLIAEQQSEASPTNNRSVADEASTAPPLPMASEIPVAEPTVAEQPAESAPSEQADSRYIETGDLNALRQRGQLRIMLTNANNFNGATAENWQTEAAIDFAVGLGLQPILLEMQVQEALPLLEAGLIDLIAADVTVTPSRKQRFGFSRSVSHTRHQAIVRASDQRLKQPADLAGRTISLNPDSSFYDTVKKLQRSWPSIKIQEDYALFDDYLLDRVAAGDIDIAVQNSDTLQRALQQRSDVRVAFNLARNKTQAWAVRKNAVNLQRALNTYLIQHQLRGEPGTSSTGDWAAIKQRGVLRAALPNNSTSYYLHNNELAGFEYELLHNFALANSLRLEIAVPDDHDSLFDQLLAGEADVAAGFLSASEQQQEGIAYTRAYHSAPQVVISRDDDTINSLEDLRGRVITVRHQSPYWRPLARLETRGLGFVLIPAEEGTETEDLIAGVATGEYDLTVAGGPTAELPDRVLNGVKVGPAIGGDVPSAWATREQNTELRQQLNAFLEINKRGTLFYNVLWAKYFGGNGWLAGLTRDDDDRSELIARNETRYDDFIREHAQKNGFDWRLISAVINQESGFNPKRRSKAGAKGLMQVMPAAAKQMRVRNVTNPENGIEAGCKYLAWLWSQLDEDIPYSSRIWFAIAAYNVGLGHVQDARILAEQQGWDSGRWFDNVENAILLLAKPKYAKKARYGYARGGETVYYVRSVRRHYNAYKLHDLRLKSRAPLQAVDAN